MRIFYVGISVELLSRYSRTDCLHENDKILKVLHGIVETSDSPPVISITFTAFSKLVSYDSKSL